MPDHRRNAIHKVGGLLATLGGGLLIAQATNATKSHLGDRVVVISLVLLALGFLLILIGAFDRPRFKPSIAMEFLAPRMDESHMELGGYPYSVFNASVPIRNAHESGGERRAAKGVKPEVEIFDSAGQEQQFQRVGWDTLGGRDFFRNHEEYRLFIAAKAEKRGFCIGTHQSAAFTPGLGHKNGRAFVDLEDWSFFPREAERLDGEKFLVRVSLRGTNLRGVESKIYILGHHGVDSQLSLTEAKKAHWWSLSEDISSWSGGE